MSEVIDHKARAHALLSASSAARWLACPPSAIAAELYPIQDTSYTQEGTLAHETAEVIARKGLFGYCRSEIPKEADKEMIDHGMEYRDFIKEHIHGAGSLLLLEQRVDFSEWVPDGFGTCDCIIIEDDTLTVIDYKYGQGVPVDAKDNPQMMLYALGALNDYGFAWEVDKIEMYIFQPRIGNISHDHIDAHGLLEWARNVVQPAARLAAEGKGFYSPGSNCRFCPHAGHCKALTDLCVDYFQANGGNKISVKKMAPHEVAEVLKMEPLITGWLKAVRESALTDLLNGKEVPGYKVVEGKAGNRRWTDELAVAEKLKAEGYALDDITETKLLSPAGMDKAIGKKKVAELLTDLLDRTPGSPSLAPITDKRPAYDRHAEALKDFE